MNQAAVAITTPDRPLRLKPSAPEREQPGADLPDGRLPTSALPDAMSPNGTPNAAWSKIVQSATNRASHETTIITVDLAQDESVREFSTRLQMLLLFMNRETDSVSATVSPSFQDDTYPAMLALVSGFHRSGASGDWSPDGPRSMRVGKAMHLFVSVDMPVADRSPSPDTLLEVVAAHRISAAWYDQRVHPRVSAVGVGHGHGLTIVMYGVPGVSGSIFERERARNLSGSASSGGAPGIHFSRQPDWTATAAV